MTCVLSILAAAAFAAVMLALAWMGFRFLCWVLGVE